jgi:hypothetical protein
VATVWKQSRCRFLAGIHLSQNSPRRGVLGGDLRAPHARENRIAPSWIGGAPKGPPVGRLIGTTFVPSSTCGAPTGRTSLPLEGPVRGADSAPSWCAAVVHHALNLVDVEPRIACIPNECRRPAPSTVRPRAVFSSPSRYERHHVAAATGGRRRRSRWSCRERGRLVRLVGVRRRLGREACRGTLRAVSPTR